MEYSDGALPRHHGTVRRAVLQHHQTSQSSRVYERVDRAYETSGERIRGGGRTSNTNGANRSAEDVVNLVAGETE